MDLIFQGAAMGKPAVSRDAFRGLFALYAAKAHHDRKAEGEHCLLKLFGSAEDLPDALLLQCSDRAELLRSETVGRLVSPRVRQITNGNAQYDHASDFLHALLRDLEQKVH
ncbi:MULTISPECIES: hypothetical protein [Bradyrhizobium]|jgi:hypothetical protein|uniref:Uncharacterized protein n=2 Tax=Bradyrhizobium ottawaense TaxID=931866 RepID=A0ABV4FLY9_9BRAD|nr:MULTISPECIES: hypothetical protein [Bradyrhizobium]BBO14901.1 hypothetical protein TM102_63710 [Bradyrhizobium sp. TM102]WLB44964.1 hypothetical protein QIH93_31240 [Bradyrhizobium ottawaense]WQN82261.1 hypothetical protein U7859_35685 [Bradyrhizobium ottawaense]BBO03104.1 hypothetical protein SG09_24540 [Bradyrhizobium ottawaense]GMO11271.1 hypothetical protein BwSF19_77170 [Bradyrhizobium ottawaense]